MKSHTFAIAVLAGSISMISFELRAQGTFQNLGFESATLIPVAGDPQGAVQFAPAFPSWLGYINGVLQTKTIPNGIPIGNPGETPFIAIMTPPGWGGWQGNYAVGFAAAMSGATFVPVAVAQTGSVPSQTKSLQFLALYPPAVFVNGQLISSVALGAGPSVSTRFGVDIAGFAGQTVELRFQPSLGINYLDDIQLSNQPIPEPCALTMVGFGALLFNHRSRLAKRS